MKLMNISDPPERRQELTSHAEWLLELGGGDSKSYTEYHYCARVYGMSK